MSRVYSARLFYQDALGAGTTSLGGPAAGYLWVVRHMTAIYLGGASSFLDGFVVTIDSGPVLWATGGLQIGGEQTYDWSGRHVLYAGEAVEFTSLDAALWSIVGSGYLLATP